MEEASAIAGVCGRMHLEEKWPLQWTRGRQVDLFKGKGNAQDCDASRGLLLADHMSQIPATVLEREREPHLSLVLCKAAEPTWLITLLTRCFN